MALSNCLSLALSSSCYRLSSWNALKTGLPVSEVPHGAIPASFRAQFASLRDECSVHTRRKAIMQQAFSFGLLTCGGVASAVELKPEGTPGEGGRPKFYQLDGSGGVQALDIRTGNGTSPQVGDKVVIHYYARLAAKQGWRFDSTYEHKDQFGVPEPYTFIVGSGDVISGLDAAVRTMKEGGLRRVVIPPSQGYQNTTQGPIPPNYSDRQRLYTTIFNPTRLANGEGSTLGTLIFDVELLRVRPV